MEEPVGDEALAHGVGEAGQFDPVHAHHAGTANLHVADEMEDMRALVQAGEGLVSRQTRRAFVEDRSDPSVRNLSRDDALAGVGLDAIDAARFARQAFPNRQQQAGDDMQRRLDIFRQLRNFPLPGLGENLFVGHAPMRLPHVLCRIGRALHRAHQAHAGFDIPLVRHHAERRDFDGGAAGLCIDEKARLGVVEQLQRAGKRERLRPVTLGEGQKLGPRGGDGMRENHAAVDHDEAVALQGLET